MYLGVSGQGFRYSAKEAFKWLSMAADKDQPYAQFELSRMYEYGDGVPQDSKEAARLVRKSAEHGVARAQWHLGLMYRDGRGYVLKDYIYAHMWFNIAASNGDIDAPQSRDLIAENMTATDILKAQEHARECAAKNYKGC